MIKKEGLNKTENKINRAGSVKKEVNKSISRLEFIKRLMIGSTGMLLPVSIFSLSSCNDPLKEEVFSQLGPTNFYNSAGDAEVLLNAAYANSQGYRDIARDYLGFNEMNTDIMWEEYGAINTYLQPFIDFTWNATNQYLHNTWNRYYSAIYRTNIVLDKIPEIKMDESRKEQILAEARFLRAFNYHYLYELFGPTPLILTSDTSASQRPERATKEDFAAFIKKEYSDVSKILPSIPEEYYRATSGASLGFLCRFYLNNKEWQNAADIAKEIIDSNTYALFTQGKRTELFALDNKQSKEFIWVIPFLVQSSNGNLIGNTYLSHAVPPNYKFKYPPHVDFAAQFKIYSAFVDTFDSKDERLEAFLFKYINTSDNSVVLGKDDIRSLKYPEDPNGIGDVTGNDFPLLRYSDILLSRAEALNELQGPNVESVNLINEVRAAAGLQPLNLTTFTGKEALRDQIVKERGWEFHTEGRRRQDLIRSGKFIEVAKQRGKEAFDYQVLFPIPQGEIDKNPKLKQNSGYE